MLSHIKFSSVAKQITKSVDVSVDQSLNSITLPDINGAIQRVSVNLNIVSFYSTSDALNRLEGAQSIQVKESVSGTYMDGITLPNGALETKVSGAGTYYIPGSIDVIDEVAEFNKTYNFQWHDLDFELADVILSVIVELEIWFISGEGGDYYVNQDGYFDSLGVFQYWTDAMKGYIKDASTGSRLSEVLITAYRVVNGSTVYALIPPGQAICDSNGNYNMSLDAGTYVFLFQKDQYRFPIDKVTRTVVAI